MFRLFVAFEVSVSSHLYNVSVIGFDGSHSRHQKFNDVIIFLIGREGKGKNVNLDTAVVNVENKDNI